MIKQDISKTVITVSVTAKIKRKNKESVVKTTFPVSLQQWIKKSPEEQKDYAEQHVTEGKFIDYEVTQ